MGTNARTPSDNLNIHIFKSDGYFVAKDTETGVTSQGETKAEALENLAEALRLYDEPIPSESEEPEPSGAPWL